jgi:hypothetical protein
MENEAKIKALELMQRFNEPTMQWNELHGFIANKYTAKTCALIAVDELISHSRNTAMVYDLSFDESTTFWNEVKKEIEKL